MLSLQVIGRVDLLSLPKPSRWLTRGRTYPTILIPPSERLRRNHPLNLSYPIHKYRNYQLELRIHEVWNPQPGSRERTAKHTAPRTSSHEQPQTIKKTGEEVNKCHSAEPLVLLDISNISQGSSASTRKRGVLRSYWGVKRL